MNTYKTTKIKLIPTKVILLIVCLFFINLDNSNAQETLGILGNSKGVPSSMTLVELKSVMKGEKQRWKDGTKIVIALMKTNTTLGQASAKKIYNMSGDELNRFWLALVFQGKASAPNFFNSMSELESFVAQTPGAIGIVKKESSNESKLIPVDGKKEF